MSAFGDSPIQVFDCEQEYAVFERRLPHWSQAGTITFITWRTWDSMPRSVREAWVRERDEWLRRHAIDPTAADWRAQVKALSPAFALQLQRQLADRWNEHLDACHGACVLRDEALCEIVADSLLHFDGERYELTDFVVMPNHVHVLAAFPDERSLLRQCDSWKHFTATRLNLALDRRGAFWQSDGFDHLVRSIEQFEHYRRYIADNPRRARLREGEYRHYSKTV